MNNDATALWYLTEEETRWACQRLDPVKIVREALVLQAEGRTTLPAEAYLGWTSPSGAAARSLSMPGYVGGSFEMAGTKIINGCLDNPERGLPRASGLTMLFDRQTARIRCVMASAHVSALRTAGVTVASAQALLPQKVITVGVIGAGAIARAHIELLARSLPGTAAIVLHDRDPGRAAGLAKEVDALLHAHGIRISLAETARDAVLGADLVIPATTTTQGYIAYDWLSKGCVVVNVSLDDVLPDVVVEAGTLLVDDWALVRDDEHRLLGRMHRAGRVVGPGEDAGAGVRRVDAELGEVFAGRHPGRYHPDDVILVNPFGLAIEDIALATEVYRIAMREGRGIALPR